MAYLKSGRTSKLIYFLTSSLLLLTSCLFSSPADAAIQWSLSVVEGYYLPRLDELNYILKHERVELGPRNIEARPFSYPVIYQGRSPAMPEIELKAPKIGLQLQADINPRYAIVFGGSMATFDSTKRDIRPFFVGFLIPANRETRFSLSLNQFWVGIKRYWVWEMKSEVEPHKDGGDSEAEYKNLGSEGAYQEILEVIKEKTKFYAEIGVLAITRAYLTTDVWLHVFAPDEGFDFYKVTETGIRGNGYATYLGVGGEYFIKKWLSIGLDLEYTIGGVGNLKYDHYFTIDPLEKDIIKPGDDVQFTDLIQGRIRQLFLDLEGWDLKGQVRVYF